MEIPNILLEKLKSARHVAVMTGAGVSAESGIATFRDPDGLWAKFNPAELASMDGFMSNPELVWSWYQHRRDIIQSCKPNPGHYVIADMQKLFPKFTLITQNVDRLHQQAGSENVLELHGNIIDNHCSRCQRPYLEEIDLSEKDVPCCKHCGGIIRPSVVWFGEMLPADAIECATEASEDCDVFFSVGTSAEVYPAANLPLLARRNGAFIVEVNPNVTALTQYSDVQLRAASGIALPKLIEKFKNFI
jgi:NAD-dependent deacetylase